MLVTTGTPSGIPSTVHFSMAHLSFLTGANIIIGNLTVRHREEVLAKCGRLCSTCFFTSSSSESARLFHVILLMWVLV